MKRQRTFRAAVAPAALAAFFAVFAPLLAGAEIFALNGVTLRQDVNLVNAIQGENDVTFEVLLDNRSGGTLNNVNASVSGAVGFSNGRFVSGDSVVATGTIGRVYTFRIDVDDNAGTGTREVPVVFTYNNGSNGTAELGRLNVRINIGRNTAPEVGAETIVLDVSYKVKGDSLKAGETTALSLVVTNRGNLMVRDVQVSLTLPEIMSLDNSLALQYIGYIAVAESKTIHFPILVDKKAENKNYAVVVKMNGVGRNESASFDRTIYIPVSGGEGTITADEIEVVNVSVPPSVAVGDPFTLSFGVTNKGTSSAKEVRTEVSTDNATGVFNQTGNVFNETTLKAGETKNYSVTFFSDKSAEQKSYPIKITVTTQIKDAAATTTRYTSVFLTKTGGDVKNPRLIIESYSYGGDARGVRTGSEFPLSLTIHNTSDVVLSNIKVTLSADGGTFLPVNAGNSFYIEQIPARASVSKSLKMFASATAQPGTVGLNVAMTYEDGTNADLNAADVISIPIVQEIILTVDDIMMPPELYTGNPNYVNVQFHNTGKGKIHNIIVSAEGDFDVEGGNASYYAGNLDSGASDSYDFAVIPRQAGDLTGKVVFSFEDASGGKQTMEKEFSATVLDMEGGEEWNPDAEAPQGISRKKLAAFIGAPVCLVLALVVVLRILRKRKMHKELELDEDDE